MENNKYVIRIQVVRMPVNDKDVECVVQGKDMPVGKGLVAERAAKAVANVLEIEGTLKLTLGGH